MTKRGVKLECYQELLQENIDAVEVVLNHIEKIKTKKDVLPIEILEKDLLRTYYNLELALASLCIIIRKMTENQFLEISDELRVDINSIIHSNNFEYIDSTSLYVYSRRGKEPVNMAKIIDFSKRVLKQ